MARHLAVDGVRPTAQRGPARRSGGCSPTSAGSTGWPAGCSRTRRPTTSRWRTCSPPTAGRPGSATGTWSRWALRSGRQTRRRSPTIPATTFARFFERHGLLRLRDQPRWRTVTGGSQRYVQAILGPLQAEGRVRLGNPDRQDPQGAERRRTGGPGRRRSSSTTSWWPPTATRLCVCCRTRTGWRARRSVPSATNPTGPPSTPTPACCRAIGGLGPAGTTTGLHADTDQATLTYHLNQLQAIPSTTPVLVTLNQDDAIDPELVLARMDYAHPVLDPGTVAAQRRHGRSTVPGARGTAAPIGETDSTRTACAARSRHVARSGCTL